VPSLQAATQAATYAVSFLDPRSSSDLQQRINDVLSAQTLNRQWKRGKNKVKTYDLRPLIVDLYLGETADQQNSIVMKLFLSSGKTGRPDEVLRAMNLDPVEARIKRTEIILEGYT
jgi:hypothetical protein